MSNDVMKTQETPFVIDVETDGPTPGLYSMISIAVVRADTELKTAFSAKLRPISEEFDPEALAVNGITRAQSLEFPHPGIAMSNLVAWVQQNSQGRARLYSDNSGFDAMFLSYYMTSYTRDRVNPFGHTCRNIADLYRGMVHSLSADIDELRKTPHTHDPMDDAMGNAEALVALAEMGLDIYIPEPMAMKGYHP